MLDSKDISVVVQGPISGEITLKCIKSIRQFLPDAEQNARRHSGQNQLR